MRGLFGRSPGLGLTCISNYLVVYSCFRLWVWHVERWVCKALGSFTYSEVFRVEDFGV